MGGRPGPLVAVSRSLGHRIFELLTSLHVKVAVLVFSQVTLSRSKRIHSDMELWTAYRDAQSSHPSVARAPWLEADLEMARQRAHFRLMSELYRQRRPITKRRRWPAVRSAAVVVPITAARKWQQAQEDPS